MSDTITSTNFACQRNGDQFGMSYPKDIPYETTFPFVAASDLQTLLASPPAAGQETHGTYVTLAQVPNLPMLSIKMTNGVGWAISFPLAYASELAGLLGGMISAWATLVNTPYILPNALSDLVQNGRLSDSALKSTFGAIDDATFASPSTTKPPSQASVWNFSIVRGDINVKDYGAKADNATDDYAAWTAAIAQAVARGGWGVKAMNGVHRLGTRLGLKSNVQIHGGGRGVTTFKPLASGVSAALFLGASGDAVANVLLADLTLDGDYATNAQSLNGIQITNGSGLSLDRVGLDDFGLQGALLNTHTGFSARNSFFGALGKAGTSSGHSLSLTASPRAKITDTDFVGGMGMGISTIGASTDLSVFGGYFSIAASTTGFEAIGLATGADRARIIGVDIYGTQDNGISLSVNDSEVSGGTINGCLDNGIEVGGSHNTIHGMTIKNAGREAAANATFAVLFAGSASSSKNTISGCTMYDDQTTKTMTLAVSESSGANYNYVGGNVGLHTDFLNAPAQSFVLVGAQSVLGTNII